MSPSDEEFVCEICETAFETERDLREHDCDDYRDAPAFELVQTGLGDADAQGQTTLDGGIQPEGGASDG